MVSVHRGYVIAGPSPGNPLFARTRLGRVRPPDLEFAPRSGFKLPRLGWVGCAHDGELPSIRRVGCESISGLPLTPISVRALPVCRLATTDCDAVTFSSGWSMTPQSPHRLGGVREEKRFASKLPADEYRHFPPEVNGNLARVSPVRPAWLLTLARTNQQRSATHAPLMSARRQPQRITLDRTQRG
jgi:hypothetical protein